MAKDTIDWIIIRGHMNKEIGAVGFLGNKAAIVAAFYDGRDANYDGMVSRSEATAAAASPIGIRNKAVSQIAMLASVEMDVIRRDPSFGQEAMKMFSSFASLLMSEGVYKTYFSRSVARVARPIGGRAVTGIVKHFVVRKGMEQAVKAAYNSAMT